MPTITAGARPNPTDGAGNIHGMPMIAFAVVGLLLFLTVLRLMRLRYLHPGRDTAPSPPTCASAPANAAPGQKEPE
ncbi:MAG: hypothetical protein Q7J64_05565 [Elusimicrobiota bacterium]|nr:hypothetical protein [Elusimicrobiota bacterium]